MAASLPAGKTFPALLAEQALRYGPREAVVGSGQRLTYAELHTEVLRVARGLLNLGVRRGDHVAILMNNRPEWIVSFLAIHQVGAVVVALNTWATPRELEYALHHADVTILLAIEGIRSHDYRQTLADVRPRLPLLQHVVWLGAAQNASNSDYRWNDWSTLLRGVSVAQAEARGREVGGEDVAFLLYSSGSTAAPKGILLRHQASIENGWNIGERQHTTADDRIWLVVSLFWSFGSVNATANVLTHGGCLCLQEKFDAGEALALIERERCTLFYGTPNMAYALQDHPDRPQRDLSSLRSGATIGTPEQLKRIMDLGVHQICNVYGLTETYGNCAVTDVDDSLDMRLHSVGMPLPGVHVRICDPETGHERDTGEIGEIRIKGYLFAGYYKDEAKTREAFDHKGYLRSGDLGLTDASGRLFYRGRITEMVKSGGINIAPIEVEETLMRHPDVHAAYVVGVADPVVDQVLAAVVVTHGDTAPSVADLTALCRRDLAAYKVPALYRFVRQEDLPLTTTGKVQKLKLPSLFMDEPPGA
ncbi:AMP-binding protein [Bordetella sp. BOR01]|uniref:AMP-binding protein n=1 Tax=Bordetella sp. BOR01 TaxID=2854779 RepID=UPI001C465FA3|nr:AMP-binding protein [Bordetella sp. BOR01]MBV7483219.1 AMP-binding protein [Bordetella sp. BOR01]